MTEIQRFPLERLPVGNVHVFENPNPRPCRIMMVSNTTDDMVSFTLLAGASFEVGGDITRWSIGFDYGGQPSPGLSLVAK